MFRFSLAFSSNSMCSKGPLRIFYDFINFEQEANSWNSNKCATGTASNERCISKYNILVKCTNDTKLYMIFTDMYTLNNVKHPVMPEYIILLSCIFTSAPYPKKLAYDSSSECLHKI